VARLQAAAGRRVDVADTLGSVIADARRLAVVAVAAGSDGETMIGWAMTGWFPLAAQAAPAGHYLTGVTVDPMRRRQGVGAALTAARLAWLDERARDVWCTIAADNTASLALHERAGFVGVGRAQRFHTMTFDPAPGILLRRRASVATLCVNG
jgi:ribosomal protein S18 acetylase RimI-like enzyme